MDAIYARQSVDKKDSISIETQIDFCRRKLENPDSFEVYSDRGYSGSNTNRPDFQRLMDDVRAGNVSRIIVYKLDRVTRSVRDFVLLIDELDKSGASFVSSQEDFDTSTMFGRMLLKIIMVFAEFERETIQQRITDNYYSRGEKGMYLGGPPPFGFKKTELRTELGRLKLLEANPETAPVLRAMYEMYGNDQSTLGEISRRLNDEGIPSPAGRSWDSSKVTRILRNPAAVKSDAEVYNYYSRRGCNITSELSEFTAEHGCYLYGKREGHERKYTDVSDHTLSLAPHDGLIDAQLFLRCQERLDGNRQIENRRKSKITWLTGLLKCDKCGYAVVPKTSNGGRYTYLHCTGKTVHSACDVRGNLGSLIVIEAIVEKQIFRWSERYSDLKATAEHQESRACNNLNIRIGEIDLKIRKLIDTMLESNSVTAGFLNERITSLNEERISLEEELYKLSRCDTKMPAKEIADIAEEWKYLGLNQKSAIAELLISRVNLGREELEIEWKYKFDL